MKKLFALVLTAALVLGLASPALADEVEVRLVEGELEDILPAEETPQLKDIADESPEVQEFLREMYEEGNLSQEDTDYDLSYFEDGDADHYAEYEAAHPEEIAALDPEKLIAGWGYTDLTAEEWFMRDYYYYDTVEEAVKWKYIDRRLLVETNCSLAEEYRAEYPDVWAEFDANSYFEGEWDDMDKEAYMAMWNIFTEDEFVDDMFVLYIDYDYYEDYDSWYDSHDEDPTLTLYVNGVATDVELTAEEGATYADADALRQFFGPEAVPADQTGLLPVRATAEEAGWDVVWYSSTWWWENRQEVQLWDKASYLAALEEQFPKELVDFLPGSTAGDDEGLFGETPTTVHQTATVDLTQFSTLDGDETFRLTADIQATTGDGVIDVTVTFDAAQLLQLFNADVLENVTQLGGFSVTQLKQFLKAGVMEFIFDFNEGRFAYNVPLLGLMDEEYVGWQVVELPGYAELLEQRQEQTEKLSWGERVYKTLLDYGESSGAEYALSQYNMTTAILATFMGQERITTRGNTVTYTLDTQTVNELMTSLITTSAYMDYTDVEDLPTFSIFKAFDLTATSTGQTLKTDLHVRLDTDGIIAAILSMEDSYDSYFSLYGLFGGRAMQFQDMDLTVSTQSTANRSTGKATVHWDNRGKVSVEAKTTTGPATKGPRSIDDIAR